MKPQTPPTPVNDDTLSEQSEDTPLPLKPELFRYQTLAPNSIRLIVLEPKRKDDGDDVVRCRLLHVSFAEKPRYEALSYTWGPDTGNPTQVVHILGTMLRVTANLHLALCCFRQDEPRMLWADAICIDQQDIQERSIQVGLMDVIYQRASFVRIWLGGLSANPSLPQLKNLDLHMIKYRDDIRSLNYWSRAWIVQEIGLSTKLSVQVDSWPIDWAKFIEGVRESEYGSKEQILKLDDKRRGRHDDANKLEQLLEDFQHCQCTEPKDKIFAFLGLAWDCDDRLKADYSISSFGLFRNLIGYFYQSGSTNDLDRSMRVVKFSQLVHKLLGNVMISGEPPSKFNLPIFEVRGAWGGSIIHLGPTYDTLFSTPEAERLWKKKFTNEHYSKAKDTKTLRRSYESYYPVLERFDAQSLSKYCAINPQYLYSNAQYLERPWNPDTESWHRRELVADGARDPDDLPSIRVDSEPTDLPRLFLGTNYLIGLAPAQAQEGDVICHFWNCDITALLRKEEKTGYSRIVGRVHLSTGSLRSDLTPFYTDRVDPAQDAKAIFIQLDINTLHFLTR